MNHLVYVVCTACSRSSSCKHDEVAHVASFGILDELTRSDMFIAHPSVTL